MAELIRGFDWSSTPLGAFDSWPTSIVTAVGLMLASQQPMFLFWSAELRCLYNDAARVLLAPEARRLALGARASAALLPTWPTIEDDLAGVLAGDAIGATDDGADPAAPFGYICSPVPDPASPTGFGGALVLCLESTQSTSMQRDSERRLSESEARFREIANAAPVMMWVTDEAQACTWCNQAWLRFTGRTLAQELGGGWTESIHPDDIDRCRAEYAAAFAERRPFRMDLRLRRHDGEWGVVDNTGAPRIGDGGVLLGFVGSCLDVTRQRETEARFRGVFNSELMGMTVFDANTGRTLAINERFLRMTGHDRADVDEGRWSRAALMPPEHEADDKRAIAQARERGWWDTYESALRHRDGTRLPVRISSAPLPGQPGRVVIAIQDITAERAAQAALVASEERLRLGLEAGRMVTWEFDLKRAELTRSSNCAAIFGWGERAEDFAARMPAEDIAADQVRLQRALADPHATYDSEFRYQHPDGHLMHLHNLALVKRDEAGAPFRIYGVCMDISERKQAEIALKLLNETLEQEVEKRTEALLLTEEALRQSQKMEALGHLTGGVAHDFNNLLGAMVGSFDLIRRRTGDEERVRLLAEAGLRAAERGVKLTSQLLTFSRGQRIELTAVVVRDVVDGMSEMLRRALGPMIALSIDADCAGRAVLSDPTQLELAVLNLAINARDAMPDGGTVHVATRLQTIDRDPALATGQYVELLIRDTGIGMSLEVAARAFDPFYTTKGVGKGTGLGLSQVYGIARHAGGTVRIDSTPGAGTTVRMLLPCTDSAGAPAEPTPPTIDPGVRQDATVLVVDDDLDLRQVLAALLEDLGYRVLEADDGASGLSMLERHAPDLLIADFAMPGMTGAELARAARARRPDLPIIFASGYADTRAIDDAAGAATRVLRKPFRIDELQSAINTALAGPRP